MKKILVIFAFIPCVLLSQTFKKDSVFLDQKYVGQIKKIGYLDSTLGFRNDNIETSSPVKYVKYDFYLDEFVSSVELDKIKFYIQNKIEYLNKTKKDVYITIEYKERFINKTKTQIAGWYLQQAGVLKKQRNDWGLYGIGFSTAIIVICPPSAPVFLFSGGVGITCSIIALVKDYKSNECLRKSGKALYEI